MTATYWSPDAPREKKRVLCESPQHHIPCTPEEPCGYCDDGYQTRWFSDCPSVKLSNANTRDIGGLLGLGRETCGTIRHADIPAILRRIMVVKAKDSERAHLVRESSDTRGPTRVVQDDNGVDRISTGPRMIDCGNQDAHTIARLNALQHLLVWAQERGYDVSWG